MLRATGTVNKVSVEEEFFFRKSLRSDCEEMGSSLIATFEVMSPIRAINTRIEA
jgi:hypothetical protein